MSLSYVVDYEQDTTLLMQETIKIKMATSFSCTC